MVLSFNRRPDGRGAIFALYDNQRDGSTCGSTTGGDAVASDVFVMLLNLRLVSPPSNPSRAGDPIRENGSCFSVSPDRRAEDMDAAEISEITGLSIEDIEQL